VLRDEGAAIPFMFRPGGGRGGQLRSREGRYPPYRSFRSSRAPDCRGGHQLRIFTGRTMRGVNQAITFVTGASPPTPFRWTALGRATGQGRSDLHGDAHLRRTSSDAMARGGLRRATTARRDFIGSAAGHCRRKPHCLITRLDKPAGESANARLFRLGPGLIPCDRRNCPPCGKTKMVKMVTRLAPGDLSAAALMIISRPAADQRLRQDQPWTLRPARRTFAAGCSRMRAGQNPGPTTSIPGVPLRGGPPPKRGRQTRHLGEYGPPALP